MEVVSLCPLRVGSLLWQPERGRYALAIVCKATFDLVPATSSLSEQQEDPNEDDNHWNDDPARSLYSPSDLAPFKPRGDVLLVGHAFAPRGEPVRSFTARIIVGEIDKAIEVFGDRSWTVTGSMREGARVTKMPLRYERAAGGPETTNPVGVRQDVPDSYGTITLPNLQPAGVSIASRSDFIDPIGFGPIAPSWPSRMEKLGRRAGSWSHARWYADPLSPDVDPAYFNSAPKDQQIDGIRDNERIVLDNLHPEHPRLVTSLPGVHPRAFVERQGTAPQALAMTADTLWIDTDRAICTVTWRGHVDDPPHNGRVLIAMEGPSQRLTWADVERMARSMKGVSAAIRVGARAPASSASPSAPSDNRPATPPAPAASQAGKQPPASTSSPGLGQQILGRTSLPSLSGVPAPNVATAHIEEEQTATSWNVETRTGVNQVAFDLPFTPAADGVSPFAAPTNAPASPASPASPVSPARRMLNRTAPVDPEFSTVSAPPRSGAPTSDASPAWLAPARQSSPAVRGSTPGPAPAPASVRFVPSAPQPPSMSVSQAAPSLQGPSAPATPLSQMAPQAASASQGTPLSQPAPPAPAATPSDVSPPPLYIAESIAHWGSVQPPASPPPAVGADPSLGAAAQRRWSSPSALPPGEAPPNLADTSSAHRPAPIPGSPWASGAIPAARADTVPQPGVSGPSPGAARGLSASKDAPDAALLAASNVAAAQSAPWDMPRPSASTVDGEEVPPESGVKPEARLEATEVIELLWFDPESLPRVRKRPAFREVIAALEDRPPDEDLDDMSLGKTTAAVEDRRDVFEILARGGALDGPGLSATLERAIREDGKLVPPFVLVAGELVFSFDELETLKASMTTVTPLSIGDDGLKGAIAVAREFLGMPGLSSAPAVAEGLTARIRDAFAQGKRAVSTEYLETQTLRALLERRHYQRREVFGDTYLRALLHTGGSSSPIPSYLPDSLARKLPMFRRFKVRMIAEAHLAVDQHETHPLSLKVTALARAVDRRT